MATNGEPITPPMAKNYFDAHANVKKGNTLRKNPPTQPTPQDNLALAISDVYNSSVVNAFLFDADLVKNLLGMKDADGNPAKYLMVHFAAKYMPEEVGNPTIVLLGCNEKNDGKTTSYISMNDPNPAVETPGTTTLPSFPPTSALNKQIIFTII